MKILELMLALSSIPTFFHCFLYLGKVSFCIQTSPRCCNRSSVSHLPRSWSASLREWKFGTFLRLPASDAQKSNRWAWRSAGGLSLASWTVSRRQSSSEVAPPLHHYSISRRSNAVYESSEIQPQGQQMLLFWSLLSTIHLWCHPLRI